MANLRNLLPQKLTAAQKRGNMYYMVTIDYSISDLIFDNLFNLKGLFSRPYNVGYKLAMKRRQIQKKAYYEALRRMQKNGYIKIWKKDDEQFIQLTNKGQIQALLRKAGINKTKSWDGKWRLFMFDIPESSRVVRNKLRKLLRLNNFKKIQASVYVNPYSLNREALSYLNESGLRKYIRIMKVEEMDNEEDLVKTFNLR